MTDDPVIFFRALADPTRWRMIRMLMDRVLCVCELAEILGLPHSTVSSHLQVIRKAGLLESVSCGKWTYVRVDRTNLAWLRRLANRFPEPAESQQDQQRALACVADRGGRCGPVPTFSGKKLTARKHER